VWNQLDVEIAYSKWLKSFRHTSFLVQRIVLIYKNVEESTKVSIMSTFEEADVAGVHLTTIGKPEWTAVSSFVELFDVDLCGGHVVLDEGASKVLPEGRTACWGIYVGNMQVGQLVRRIEPSNVRLWF
jgi:hypothetical protein